MVTSSHSSIFTSIIILCTRSPSLTVTDLLPLRSLLHSPVLTISHNFTHSLLPIVIWCTHTATVTHSLTTSSIPSLSSLSSPTHQLTNILRLNWLAFSSPPSLDPNYLLLKSYCFTSIFFVFFSPLSRITALRFRT